MLRKIILPLLAVGGLVFAVLHMVRAQTALPDPPPPVEPGRSPYGQRVAATGIVEPRTENIAIGSHLPGVVDEVMVKVGQKVTAGTPLFRLDDRQLRAELEMRQALAAAARAKLEKLEQMPRPEEVPPAEARVREAEAAVAKAQDLRDRSERLGRSGASSEEERVQYREAHRMADEQLARAQADLKLLKAGAWEPDKAVARAELAHAESQAAQTQTELERLIVRASVDGEVLQVNVRPGEFVGAPAGQALIV